MEKWKLTRQSKQGHITHLEKESNIDEDIGKRELNMLKKSTIQ